MENILSRISSDPSLREAVLSQLGLGPVSSEDPLSHVRVTTTTTTTTTAALPSAVSSQLASGSSQPVVYSHQSDNNDSPLAARVHQSGANTNDPLAARVHKSGVDDAINPSGGHQIETSNESSAGPADFDPARYTADDEYTFDAQSAITNYIEKHFRSTLDRTSRSAMHKEHPVPNTQTTKAPKVDGFVTDYLKAAFLRAMTQN